MWADPLIKDDPQVTSNDDEIIGKQVYSLINIIGSERRRTHENSSYFYNCPNIFFLAFSERPENHDSLSLNDSFSN